ncbi:MAG: glycosyltransferase WbuB [Winogradskyella sp.]|nr:MAG: glycosyltransferase WbuB [Winogradskyella sp.]
MQKKNIWLINQYLCTPELNGDGHRHSYLAEHWIKKGYDVTLITSSFSHVPYRHNKFKGLFKIKNDPIRTLLIKGNKYGETQGVSRIFSWIIFFSLLFFIPTKKLPKPDIIIVSSNSLLPILNTVYFFKKRFKGLKFVLEIRDIWPLTLTELGGFSTKNLFIRFLAWVEKLGYNNADHIVSLLINTDEHIKNITSQKPKKYSWISNGFDLNNIDKNQVKISQKMQQQIPKNGFIIGYAGSLGKANAMEYIINAVNNLNKQSIYVCIVGSGNDTEKLKDLAKDTANIIFFDRIPKKQVQSFLSYCDLLFFSTKKSNLYKYGISANKTFDYMYAEKPILLSASTKDNVIEIADCGYVVEPENEKVLIEKILEIEKMSIEERQAMGMKGKKYLLENLSYQKLGDDFVSIFKSFYA